MRIFVTTPFGQERIAALVAGCGSDSPDVTMVPWGDAAHVLATGDADAMLVEIASGYDPRALLDAGAERDDAVPVVLLAEQHDATLALLANERGVPVCLWAHGPGPVCAALARAARNRAEIHALRASEHVRALVNVSVSDVVFHLGVEGDRFRFLEVNPMFLAATGLREDRVVGRWVDEVIPEPSLSLVLEKYREAIAARHTVRWEEVTEYPSGTKYGEVSVTPIVDARGRCTRLLGTVHDVTEPREHERAVRRYADIVRAIQIGLTTWSVGDTADAGSVRLLAFNPAAEQTTGTSLAACVGAPVAEVFPSASEIVELLRAVARDRAERQLPAYRFADARTFRVKAFPVGERLVGLAIEDVTAEARARAITVVEQRVLEMVASGRPLPMVLEELVVAIERQTPPAKGSVLLLAPDGIHIRHGAAPHLAEGYNRAIDGAPIGPRAGSCGTAAALRKPVIVSDIEIDPLWDDYRALARQYALRACWSTPILASDGRVLGTFALYYAEPRSPTELDLEIIARATHVAGIAIQRDEIDQQLRDLAARIEAAREEERTGIAREIHDQLGQALTALKIDVAWIGRRARSEAGIDRGALLAKVQELSAMIDEIVQEVRRISADLRPGLLDDIGLVAALSWQAEEFEKRTGVACTVHAEPLGEERLSREVSTAVFRVFQEALTNVVRHAGATRVDVRVAETGGAIVLEVRDDGAGMRPEAAQDPRSLGLVGIRERARRLGGSATFERAEPRGTLVKLRIPLPPR